MIRIILIWLASLFSFLIFSSPIFAVSVTITDFPASASSEIFNVSVLISGATNATNYLRLDLYKEGTSNYFGETYNGMDWYGGSDGKSYFPILIQNSSASATLQAQIGNPGTTDYSGPGTYKLRIRRYTSSGSQSQNDQQTPVDIQLIYATPTPTPTPTLTPTPTPTQTNTPTPTPMPTSTPTPTPRPSILPTVSPTISPSPKIIPTGLSLVLGESSQAATPNGLVSEKAKDQPVKSLEKKNILTPVFLILGALAILGAGLSTFWLKRKKGIMTG